MNIGRCGLKGCPTVAWAGIERAETSPILHRPVPGSVDVPNSVSVAAPIELTTITAAS